MRAATTVAVISLAVGAFGAERKPNPPATEPNLAETDAWLTNTYSDHSTTGGSFGYGEWRIFNGIGQVLLRKTESIEAHGCDISLSTIEDPRTFPFRHRAANTSSRFNLSDIDSHTIKVQLFRSKYGWDCENPRFDKSCDIGTISFETRDRLPLISQTIDINFPDGSGSSKTINVKSYHEVVYLNDLSYGLRFRNAFIHALGLCAKKEPF